MPVAKRVSGRFTTSSYSKNKAVLSSGHRLPCATCWSTALLAPDRLRKAATITDVSSTTLYTSHKVSYLIEWLRAISGCQSLGEKGPGRDMFTDVARPRKPLSSRCGSEMPDAEIVG